MVVCWVSPSGPQQHTAWSGRADGCAAVFSCAVGMSSRYADRQEDELLFLREVFRSDLEDLREKDPWKASHTCVVSLSDKLFCVMVERSLCPLSSQPCLGFSHRCCVPIPI